MCCKCEVITRDVIFETISKRLTPLQLFGSDNLPFFGRIFKHPFCYSSTSWSFLNNRSKFEIKSLFSLFNTLMAFGETPSELGDLCKISFLMSCSNSYNNKGRFMSERIGFCYRSSKTLHSISILLL